MADTKVSCKYCGHPARISARSNSWRCNCHAEDSECDCREINLTPGIEDNPPDRSSDIAELEQHLAVLRGQTRPEGGLS